MASKTFDRLVDDFRLGLFGLCTTRTEKFSQIKTTSRLCMQTYSSTASCSTILTCSFASLTLFLASTSALSASLSAFSASETLCLAVEMLGSLSRLYLPRPKPRNPPPEPFVRVVERPVRYEARSSRSDEENDDVLPVR